MNRIGIPAAVAAALLAVVAAAPVAAAPVVEPFPVGQFTLTGVCAFPVDIQGVIEGGKLLTLDPDRNGDQRSFIFGRSTVRVTNASTPSKSVLVDNSGPVAFTVHPDGTYESVAVGPGIWWFFAGEPLGPALYQTSGIVRASFDAADNITSARILGPRRDLCAELA